MKFFHLADLHSGKRLNEFSLLDDQAELLDQVVELADTEQPDCVLLAGDLFDKPVPSEEAVRIFGRFISALTDRGIKVLAISGNHDSGARVAQYSPLLERSGFYIHGNPENGLRVVSLEFEDGPADIYLLPYIVPAQVRRLYPDEEITGFDDALRVMLEHVDLKKDRKNILISHQFYQGTWEAKRSDSERMMIGGLEQVSAAILEPFDYVALGHLHRPQKAGFDHARYPGSLMKYSFSEKQDEKGLIIGEFTDEGLSLDRKILNPPHGMQELTGSIRELTRPQYHTDDYVKVNLTDMELIANASSLLRENFPNLMEISFLMQEKRPESEGIDIRGMTEARKSPERLFSSFFEQSVGTEMSPSQEKIVHALFSEMTGGERE